MHHGRLVSGGLLTVCLAALAAACVTTPPGQGATAESAATLSAEAAPDDTAAQPADPDAAEAPDPLTLANRELHRDPEVARTLAHPLCEDGDPEGCRIVARALQRQGAFEEAAPLLERACEESWRACLDLSLAMFNGWGVERDQDRARALALEVCLEHGPEGCYMAARTAPLPEEARAAYAEALGRYADACDGENQHHCLTVAQLYEEGIGVPADPARAAELAGRSCAAGFFLSCVRQARLIVDRGAQGTLADAREILDRTCAAPADAPRLCPSARPDACHALFLLDDPGKGEVPGEAVEALGSRCEKRHAPSCLTLASLHRRGRIATDGVEAEGIETLPALCERIGANRCANDGWFLLMGAPYFRQVEAGLDLLLHGCNAGDPTACHYLSRHEEVPDAAAALPAARRVLADWCEAAGDPCAVLERWEDDAADVQVSAGPAR